MKGCLDDLKHLISQCSFLDCWLSWAPFYFLIGQLKKKKQKTKEWETLRVKKPKSFLNATKLGLVFKSLQRYSWINLHVPNSAAPILSGSTENRNRVRTAVFGFLQLQTFVKMKDILTRAQNSKQSSHTQVEKKNLCESWQTGHTQLWKYALMYTLPFFLLLCMCCPPHQADHFIKLNWFGYACRVLKGMYILKVIHFGYAPVAVKGTDGGMRWLRCLGHISCLEKVFQQRVLYATLNFQDVTVSVNKLFECIKFTPRWRKKYTTFFFFFF